MPDVTFTGEGRHDPEQVSYRGVVFPLGVPVTVSEDVAAKLRTNSHFRVSDEIDLEESQPIEPPKRKPGRPPKVK